MHFWCGFSERFFSMYGCGSEHILCIVWFRAHFIHDKKDWRRRLKKSVDQSPYTVNVRKIHLNVYIRTTHICTTQRCCCYCCCLCVFEAVEIRCAFLLSCGKDATAPPTQQTWIIRFDEGETRLNLLAGLVPVQFFVFQPTFFNYFDEKWWNNWNESKKMISAN